MLWANNPDGIRIQAWPNARATCPVCQTTMIAKCGDIVIHHWAHESTRDCDPWWEPETEWHRSWKLEFPNDWQEVVVGNHRADVKTTAGRVIEFQRSSISSAEITEREQFYGDMCWILHGEDFEEWFDVRESSRYAKRRCLQCGMKQGWPMRESVAYTEGRCCAWCGGDLEQLQVLERPYWTFRWKHPRKSWMTARKPIGIDLDGMIFWIRKLYQDEHCAGWGVYQTHKDFIASYDVPVLESA
jgi:hypothetical protein